jgi:hypothetical protein
MKGNQMSKSLKVVSISVDDSEHECIHPLPSSLPEAVAIVATLQGVLAANAAIKSFEVV